MILERLKKEQVTYPALLNIKSVGFHILLLRVTIRDCHSFRSYKVQSWKAVYISRRCQIAEKDNNCVNFWCRKNLTMSQPATKRIVLAFLIYFMSKLNSLMKEIVSKRDLWSRYGTKSAAVGCKQAANDDERCQSFGLVFSNICTNYSVISMP